MLASEASARSLVHGQIVGELPVEAGGMATTLKFAANRIFEERHE
jgi:hypothetical protein